MHSKINRNVISKNTTKFCPMCNKSVSRYDRHVKTAYRRERLDGELLQPQKTDEGKFKYESCRIEVFSV